MQIHIVQKGDTLWKISRSYDVSFDELKKLNAHLANPEYIVPGMKIFIPETSKMESMRHPYSEERPMKKEMVKKEEVKVQPHPGTTVNLNYQPSHPVTKAQPAPKTQPVQKTQPVHKAQPVPKAQPVQPIPIVPPIQQPLPPIQPHSMPYHIMPVPDLDMTPSPQGWRLIESTSIHINIHNEDQNKVIVNPAPEVSPVTKVTPAPPVQPIPQEMSPTLEEPCTDFNQMFPFEQFPSMDLCNCMQPQMHQQMQPQMQPQMHQQMHPWGAHPCIQICYIPVFPCPPFPYQRY